MTEPDRRTVETDEEELKGIEKRMVEIKEKKAIRKKGYISVKSRTSGKKYKAYYLPCPNCGENVDNWELEGDSSDARTNQEGITVICPRCAFQKENCAITSGGVVIH